MRKDPNMIQVIELVDKNIKTIITIITLTTFHKSKRWRKPRVI